MKEIIFSLLTRNLLKMATVFFLIAAFLHILSPFFIPLLFGGIFAMALSPYVAMLMKKGLSRNKAINILIAIIFLLGLIPSIIFLIKGVNAISPLFSQHGIMDKILEYQNLLMAYLDQVVANFGFSTSQIHQYSDQLIRNIGQFLLNMFSNLVRQIPDLILVSIITFISIYFFLFNEDNIRKLFNRFFYLSLENSDRFISVLKSCCREVFLSNVLTGLIQAIIVTIGALICGISEGFIVFFITFICSFVPVLGAGPIAFVLSISLFAQNLVGHGIGMLFISIITGLTDNLIRPYLASIGEVRVNGFISFLAVIGGVIMFGLPGLFVGPLIASLVFGLIPIVLEDYFPQKISQELTAENEISSN